MYDFIDKSDVVCKFLDTNLDEDLQESPEDRYLKCYLELSSRKNEV